MFIIALILGVLALATLAAGLLAPKTATLKEASPGRKISRMASPILGVLAVICLATTMVYAKTQVRQRS